MKIVHVTNWYIPGVGYQENYLPVEQKKLGHEVEIITSDRTPVFKGFTKNVGRIINDRIIGVGAFEDNGIVVHRLPRFFELKSSEQIVVKGIKEKLSELKPDVIHAHNPFSPIALQAVLYSKKLGYKVFIDDHSHKNNLHINSLSKLTYVHLLKTFYTLYGKRINCFLPVTYASKELLRSVLSIPDDRMELLHLGTNMDLFYHSAELRSRGRSELGVDAGDMVLMTSGKLNDNKDTLELIQAFKAVADSYPGVKLVIIGGGPDHYMERIMDTINKLNLKDQVILKDFVPNKELPKYYNSADIGIWPGDHSISVIDAIATGLAVIVPDNDVAYNVLFENKAAGGYERKDVRSLSNKIMELAEDKRKIAELSQNSLQLAENVLSWKRIAEKSISIYNSK